MTVKRYRRRYIGALLMGVISITCENADLVAFNPPFSDTSYACRCRPSLDDPFYKNIPKLELTGFHRKVCELKHYMRDCHRHVLFFKKFFQDPSVDVIAWFIETEKYALQNKVNTSFWYGTQKEILKNKSALLKDAFKQNFILLESLEIKKNIRSGALKSAVNELVTQGSFQGFEAYWNALQSVVDEQGGIAFDAYFKNDIPNILSTIGESYLCNDEQRVAIAYVLLKDYLDYAIVLINHIQNIVKSQREEPSALFHLIKVYTAINALPIHQTLKTIDTLFEQLNDLIDGLNAGNDGRIENWLWSKWITFPLSIGIIIVKVVYYLLTRKNMTSVHEQQKCAVGNVLVRPFPQQGILCSS